MKKKDDTSWGSVSDWYDDLLETNADTYQSQVILPNLMRLLSPRKGMTILDLACGQGFFTRAFAAAGATAIGVDASPELIDRARARAAGVSFHVAPATAVTAVEDHSVDAITIILALQNIEDMPATVAEAARLLRSGGRLYIVLNHPAFRIPKRSQWGFDETTNTQYRRVDEYISESRAEIEMAPGRKDGAKTISFHRPLQAYFKTFQKNGFVAARLEEWVSHKESAPGPRQSAENRARKEFPLFLFIEAVSATI